MQLNIFGSSAALLQFSFVAISVMPVPMVSLVCGHVKISINDAELPHEFPSFLPISPSTSPAAPVCETAIAAQKLIADNLQKHCPSLRDAMYLAKHMLNLDTTKKLLNINAAHSAYRDETSVSAAEFLQKVENDSKDHMTEHIIPEYNDSTDHQQSKFMQQEQIWRTASVQKWGHIVKCAVKSRNINGSSPTSWSA